MTPCQPNQNTPLPLPSENLEEPLKPKPSKKLLALMESSGADHARFWEKVDKRGTHECWNWKASKNKGYGACYIRGGGLYPAPRVSYFFNHGNLPDNMFVCHKCDNPPCVNPAHLFLGNHKDNAHDALRKGRFTGQSKRFCKHGHEFTPDNIYVRPSRPNQRRCIACLKLEHARFKSKKTIPTP